jgi:hypothetical protein
LDGLPAHKKSEVFRPRQQVSVTNYNAVFVTGSWNRIAFYYGIRVLAGPSLLHTPPRDACAVLNLNGGATSKGSST